jgi:hypothetical protein
MLAQMTLCFLIGIMNSQLQSLLFVRITRRFTPYTFLPDISGCGSALPILSTFKAREGTKDTTVGRPLKGGYTRDSYQDTIFHCKTIFSLENKIFHSPIANKNLSVFCQSFLDIRIILNRRNQALVTKRVTRVKTRLNTYIKIDFVYQIFGNFLFKTLLLRPLLPHPLSLTLLLLLKMYPLCFSIFFSLVFFFLNLLCLLHFRRFTPIFDVCQFSFFSLRLFRFLLFLFLISCCFLVFLLCFQTGLIDAFPLKIFNDVIFFYFTFSHFATSILK